MSLILNSSPLETGEQLAVEQQNAVNAAIAEHADHRFAPVTFQGEHWDLTHLNPFAFHREPDPGVILEIVVLFSCHCFTHGIDKDSRSPIPSDEIYKNGKEHRVLNPERYKLSHSLLPLIVRDLAKQRIIVANPGANYVTYERKTTTGVEHYGVFFEVSKAKNRKHRLILRIQSAYLRVPTTRHKEAKKVGFDTLLRAANQGRTIKP